MGEILDEKEGEFTTVATWNGTLTRGASRIYKIENVPKSGDYVTKRRVKYDRSTLTITDENSAGGASEVKYLGSSTVVVHSSLAVIEWSAVDDRGTRHFDSAAAKSVQAIIDRVFTQIAKGKAATGGA